MPRPPISMIAVAAGDARRAGLAALGAGDRDRRESVAVALAAVLDQHGLAWCRRGRRASACAASAAASRRRAARALTISRSSCGMRAAGVSGRGEKGKMCAATMSQSSSSFSVFSAIVFGFGRKAGDQVGADRRIGPRRLEPLDRARPPRRGCGGASSA